MKYRRFGNTDIDVSVLGFGCMRLPVVDGDHTNIDEPEATRMLRYAIDNGVNYLDTAYPYHGGNSERFLGRALQDGYRDKVHLATKMPVWEVKTGGDFDRFLNEQLQKLQTDHIDFYLLHGLNKGEDSWPKVRDLGVLDWARGAMADGRFGHLGFSFHDDFDVFKGIVDSTDLWTFCQVQYNYMDIENQAGTKGVQYAAARDLAVVNMEGLLGGRLVDPPAEVQALWDSASVTRTPVEWALHWLWNQPEISVVLSGMSTMEQVELNLATAAASGVGILSDEELSLIAQVRDKYNELCPIPCTDCKYCMPCPNDVNIPRNFSIYNQGNMYNIAEKARDWYRRMSEENRASACIQCRECEDKCPQHIFVSEWMPIVDEVLGEGKPYICALP